MKKIICLAVCMGCLVVASGCGKESLVNEEPPKENVSESVEGTEDEEVWVDLKEDVALDSYEDGKWQEKECSMTNIDSSSSENICDVRLTINAYEKLRDEEIMEIMDYYWEEKFDDGENYNDSKVKYIFAVIYDKDSYDVLEKVKYGSEGKMDITQEDEYTFESIVSYEKAYDDDDGVE